MEEVSRSHEGKPPFWSGNLVGASPYAASFFAYYSERLFHAFWVGRLSLKEDSRVSPLDAL